MTGPHPWMPSSACGIGCVDRNSAQAGLGVVACRAAGVVGLLLTFPMVNFAMPKSRRDAVQRSYARALMRCCGIRLRIIDDRGIGSLRCGYAEPGDGLLLVADHVGWLDILALAAVQPVSFVARRDLIDWPVLGRLARLMRVIPIDRQRLRELPAVVAEIGERIARGERIAAFPEGTTWCGRANGTLRPALFQSAVDTDTAVQPVRLRYLDGDEALTTWPAFIGDETMFGSILRMLRSARTTAEVVLVPVEPPGADRRELAARCERAMRGEVRLEFVGHEVEMSSSAGAAISELHLFNHFGHATANRMST